MIGRKSKSNSFPIRLSTSMRLKVKELSKQEGISINHFICLALAEKMARLHQFQVNERALPGDTAGVTYERPVQRRLRS